MASQWPPRSPHEALLGTPSGRDRLRRLAERTSPSPSPSKLRTSRSVSALDSKYSLEDQPDEDAEDDDEDEEILKLQLQAIEAKLKLKKLKAAKAQKKAAASASEEGPNGLRPVSAPGDAPGLRELPIQSKIAAARDRMERQNGQAPIQVPASPVKRANSSANHQTSPQRVVLGIDKGLRAADVSLKRAPSLRRSQDDRPLQKGGYLRRTKTPVPGHAPEEEARPMTFNERLASARSEEAIRLEKQQRIKNIRSSAFSVGKEEMEDYKTKAADIPEQPYKPEQYTRSDVLSAAGRTGGGQLPRSSTVPNICTQPPSRLEGEGDSTAADSTTTSGDADSEASFEAYSGLHLSKRILPHKVLTRAIRGMKTYLIKDLLKNVKSPNWSLPDVESDIVVFAIVASKSDPRSHKPGPGGEGKAQKDRGKYMVVTLVDLQFELELYLFNSGFDRFWKLVPGTVLAILNPSIIPPPPGREATGRFGLVINSDADTILEIGNARDLGYCKSVKKDGQMCSTWINIRRTEYCEFHTNEAIRKTRSGRIELNNTTSFGGGERGPRSKHNEVWGNKKQQREKTEEELKRGNYDRFAHATYFVNGAHRTAMDDEREGGLADRAEREEGLKRKLQRQEKERDIAKRLGEMGGGAGKEYMSRAAKAAATATAALGSSISSSSTAVSAAVSGSLSSRITNTSLSTAASNPESSIPQRWDARALGLVGKRGEDGPKISLAPVKRKRPESSASSSTAGGGSLSGNKGAALGWGSALGTKLARMKDGERLDGRKGSDFAAAETAEAAAPPPPARSGDRSPVRKKTRFVTEKGIREAGRESLGEPLSAAAKTRRQVILDDDDDDDLIIVK
ncbi:hypothetical protein B0T16DRAFT_204783 [Cercophora newfieldiana]|uniref:Zinc finger Mcm10/DnaG-type domain-containing protein n=1 Tax=Cercophora newfieldiana TaxID=92897 RepID=A0AA39XW80_9PEZI|nr:hypothetical protein B0T16DRAFT_204783 [Cercophora newfieldiana]